MLRVTCIVIARRGSSFNKNRKRALYLIMLILREKVANKYTINKQEWAHTSLPPEKEMYSSRIQGFILKGSVCSLPVHVLLVRMVGHMSRRSRSFARIQVVGSASTSGSVPSLNKSELPKLWGKCRYSTGTSMRASWLHQQGDQSLKNKHVFAFQLPAYPLQMQPPGSVSIRRHSRCPWQNDWYILLIPTRCIYSGRSLDRGISSASV